MNYQEYALELLELNVEALRFGFIGKVALALTHGLPEEVLEVNKAIAESGTTIEDVEEEVGDVFAYVFLILLAKHKNNPANFGAEWKLKLTDFCANIVSTLAGRTFFEDDSEIYYEGIALILNSKFKRHFRDSAPVDDLMLVKTFNTIYLLASQVFFEFADIESILIRNIEKLKSRRAGLD